MTIPSCQLKSHLLVLKLAPLWGGNCVKSAEYFHEEISMYEGNRFRMPYPTTTPPPRSPMISYVSPLHHHQHNPFTPSPSYASHVSLLAFILFAKHYLPSLTFSVASSSSSYPIFHSVVFLLPSDGLNNNTHFPLLFSHILLVSYILSVGGLTVNWNGNELFGLAEYNQASPVLIGTLSFLNKVFLPQTN